MDVTDGGRVPVASHTMGQNTEVQVTFRYRSLKTVTGEQQSERMRRPGDDL